MNKLPAGIRTTKPGPLSEPSDADLKKAFNKKERDVYIHIWDEKDTVHSDQTYKFLICSRSGHCYPQRGNAEPIENLSVAEMIGAYLALIA